MVMDPVKKRQTYAVQTGDFVGQLFIVCVVSEKGVGCLSVPDMKNVLVPTDKWALGRNSDIIEYVETLPHEVYMISETQYFANEDSNN
jgi:hypothetical protein